MNRGAERKRLVELKQQFVENFDCGDCQPENEKCRKCLTEKEADHLLDNGIVVPPCKVGDKFYRIETWCTEGGFWEEPKRPYSSTCEDCCEECDGKKKIEEYTFNSIIQILELERYFGESVFLTREEAEKALRKEDENGKATM